MKLFFIHAVITLVLLWATIVALGSSIDGVCVEGRLSVAQAEALNSLPWGKCPGYRNGNCKAEERDRVLVGECSEFSKTLSLGKWF